MFKKVILFALIFFNAILHVRAQQDTSKLAARMKPAFRHLLLELSTTYFTVVNENVVDLDSSLIHVSKSLSLSRVPIVAEGIADKEILDNAQWVDERKPWIGQKQLSMANGKKHAILSILLGAYYAFEPGNAPQIIMISKDYLNAGINESAQLHDIELKLIGQRLLAKLYLKSEKIAEADQLFTAVKDNFIKVGNLPAAAATYSWWGLYAPVKATSTVPRIAHTEAAVEIFKSLGDSEGQINSLMNDVYLHMLQYNMPGAEKIANQALTLVDNIHFPYSHYVSGALMSITIFEGKFGEPLTYGIESAKSAETTGDNFALPYFYGAIGDLYQSDDNRQDMADKWERKSISSFLSQHQIDYRAVSIVVDNMVENANKSAALEYLKKISDEVPPTTILDHFFYTLTLGNCAVAARQWAEAHRFYNEAAKYEKEEEKHGLSVRKQTILNSMAYLFYKEGNYKKAKIYYDKYFSQRSIMNGSFFQDNANALSNMIKIDSLNGDYKAQLKNYRLLTEAIEQNYTVSKTKLAEELQVKYSSEAKTNQIKILNQKDDLAQANLKQAKTTRNITIAGIILVIIIAGLLYRQSKIRKTNNILITRKNEVMQKLLEEKEWLVKEIHHRVKNNLHTIICLLESQALYLDNDALKAIENSQHRIYAMSLIHQKLYQSDDIKVIDMNLYLTEFVKYLEESFGSPEHIKVIVRAESVKLGAGQAIPMGLIINEAVNNSFKYAFPKHREGEIAIELKKIDDEIQLSIKDNGIGFKRKTDQELNSLGLELIKGLALDLRGEMKFDTDNGANIKLKFKIDYLSVPTDNDALLILS